MRLVTVDPSRSCYGVAAGLAPKAGPYPKHVEAA